MKEVLYIFSSDCKLSKSDDIIKCVYINKDREEITTKIPIERLDSIEVYGNTTISIPLFSLANEIGCPIFLNDYYGNPVGKYLPENETQNITKLFQYQTHFDLERKLHVAKQIVKKAIFERIRILKKFDKEKITVENQIKMQFFSDKCENVSQINELRGMEGNYMKVYFESFSKILKQLPFNGRTTNPPMDEGNAILSWGNVLLYNKVRSIIYKTGLDTKLGYLHDPHENRDSLAIDIAEIFRPIIVDNLILRLDHKRNLLPVHFDKNEIKCYLNNTGKQIWIKEWKEFLESSITYQPLSRKIALHEEIKLEAYNLIKYLSNEKDIYEPLSFSNG